MAAKSENPFDDYGDSLQLLLGFYDISKTVVFWMNVFLILSTAITGSFGQSYFATIKHIEMVVRRICSMFQTKPLDMKNFQDDTMLMREQRRREKNRIEKFASLKRKISERKTQNELSRQSIYDWLADALDFVLDTKSHHRRRYSNREEADSASFAKSATKDMSSFRNLNTLIVAETSIEQLFICQECGFSNSDVA